MEPKSHGGLVQMMFLFNWGVFFSFSRFFCFAFLFVKFLSAAVRGVAVNFDHPKNAILFEAIDLDQRKTNHGFDVN